MVSVSIWLFLFLDLLKLNKVGPILLLNGFTFAMVINSSMLNTIHVVLTTIDAYLIIFVCSLRISLVLSENF